MRDAGIATRAIHAGEAPDPATGASAPPIVTSTTFVTERPEGFSIHAFAEEKPYIYGRWGNPTVDALEAKVAALEEAPAAVAFASGMAASAAVLLSLLSAGDELIISEINYPGTAELARQTLPRFGIHVQTVDSSDLEALEAALQRRTAGADTRVLWLETPANPILRLTDIEAASQLAHAHDALVVVDSTFASPILTRPLTLGADFVVHSLTKYIGGHGDALGGVVCGASDAMAALRQDALIHQGGVLSPFNAWLIARGMATLPMRMQAHSAAAAAVAAFLEAHPAVARVLYPGLPSHPQHELAQRQMSAGGGMLAFVPAATAQRDPLAQGRYLAQAFADRLAIVHYAVSLGHQRSLIYWIETEAMLRDSYQLDAAGAQRFRDAAGAGLFRVSIGLEDAQDICADLDRVLRAAGEGRAGG
ncbi:MAG: PLP-dependent aspartate aminotransferase family protein [Pseudomonadota bacterium]